MTKIKICGLGRQCDISAVNSVKPDYCGFIIDVPESRRSITVRELRRLTSQLDSAVTPVGVFVNEQAEKMAGLLNEGTIAMAQLHGQETEDDIRNLRSLTDRPLIQAFRIVSVDDLIRAERSTADYVLLDSGAGTGRTFDWNLLTHFERPFFLAGGLGPDNLEEALGRVKPYGVDMSSKVETDGCKDPYKIEAAVAVVRRGNNE